MARGGNSYDGGNFSSFSSASIQDVWPWPGIKLNLESMGNSTFIDCPKEKESSALRMIKVHRDGGVGYIASHTYGVLRFKIDAVGKVLEENEKDNNGMFFGQKNKFMHATGLSLSNDNRYLVVAGFKKMFIFDVSSPLAKSSAVLIHEVDVRDLCRPPNGDDIKYRNGILLGNANNILYVDGHIGSSTKGGASNVLHRLVLSQDNSIKSKEKKNKKNKIFAQCQLVLGNLSNHVGSADKCGYAATITRPHDFILLPPGKGREKGSGREVLVMPDIDNHGIRTVEINVNTNKDQTLNANDHCTKTISYDEELYYRFQEKKFDENHWYRINKKQQLKSPPLREPYISYASTKSLLTFENATSHCKRMEEDYLLQNSGLCTLRELRHSILTDWNLKAKLKKAYDDSMWNVHDSLPPFWTNQTCKGCWKKDPGVCTDNDPNWDSDYWMVATINIVENFNDGGIQTKCIHESQGLDNDNKDNDNTRIVICCAERGFDDFEITEDVEVSIIYFIILYFVLFFGLKRVLSRSHK